VLSVEAGGDKLLLLRRGGAIGMADRFLTPLGPWSSAVSDLFPKVARGRSSSGHKSPCALVTLRSGSAWRVKDRT